MRVAQEMVETFMRRVGERVNDRPTLVTMPEAERRKDLIQEEAQEYEDAVAAGDLTKVADAIGDLLYVVLGAAVLHGIEIQPIFGEIHRSNMTKDPVDPATMTAHTQFKRCVKGPNYSAPQLSALLLRQVTGLEHEGRDL